jgi:hypothetical protein
MFSFIGQHFVALTLLAFAMFFLTLLSVSVGDNLRSRRIASRGRAPDRTVDSATRVPS